MAAAPSSEKEILMTELGGGGSAPDSRADGDDEAPVIKERLFESRPRHSLQLLPHHLIAIAVVTVAMLACAFLLGRTFGGATTVDACGAAGCEAAQEQCDIAIIGGGIGGVYTAQRLASHLAGNSICLFESSARVGGRLWSVTIAGAEGMPLEVGGMRHVPETHPMVAALARSLNLSTQSQPVMVEGNYAFLRNTFMPLETMLNGSSLPYYLLADERRELAEGQQGPMAFYMRLVAEVLPPLQVYRAWNSCSWDNWIATATFRGWPLRLLSVEYCLRQLMSTEALAAMSDFLGFSDIMSDNNAAEIVAFERKEDAANIVPPFLRFNEGYQEVPLRLLKQAVSAGVRVFLNRTLAANLGPVTRSGAQALRLVDGALVHVRQHVIYALPRAALEAITPLGAELETPAARAALGAVKGFDLFKLFLLFDEPWWLEALPAMQCQASGTCGTLMHSDPDRRVFFWGVTGRQPGAARDSTTAAVMVTYVDSAAAHYWSSMFRGTPEGEYYLRPNPWGMPVEPATSMRVLALQEAMRELRGLVAAANASAVLPEPYAATYGDWTQRQKGVHSWAIGSEPPAMRRLLRSGAAVSVCGEAYSDMQGWAEGALRSCEALLVDKWKLPPPSWYPADLTPLSEYLACA